MTSPIPKKMFILKIACGQHCILGGTHETEKRCVHTYTVGETPKTQHLFWSKNSTSLTSNSMYLFSIPFLHTFLHFFSADNWSYQM